MISATVFEREETDILVEAILGYLQHTYCSGQRTGNGDAQQRARRRKTRPLSLSCTMKENQTRLFVSA